ncbi:MAG: hypothetical protein AB8B99_08405 [Phormidesmis sp.]
MKSIFTYLSTAFSNFKRVLKPVMAASVCALLVFSVATPAWAFGGSDSKASKGLEQLENVQSKSEDAIASGPKSGANGTRSVTKDSNEGLNGVQGAANKENMISPEDAKGTTIKDSIEDALESVMP